MDEDEVVDYGMIELTVVMGDTKFGDRRCPHCHERYMPGQRALLSHDLRVAIHKVCVIELAERGPNRRERERERYEAKKRQILTNGTL